MSLRSTIVGRRGGLVLALAAVAVGAVLLAFGLRSQVEVPQTRSRGSIDPPAPTSTDPSVGPHDRAAPAPLGPSRPVRLQIPSLVDTPVFPIGLDADGSLAVPQPGPREDQAAWFDKSPAPGQPGPAVLEGHVDTAAGPSVFFHLAEVQPGAAVRVQRADGVRLVFRVDAVRDFRKASFPTRLVYGAEDLAVPALRLITCSDFDPSIRHHVGNTVVFAHLATVRRPDNSPDVR